MSLSTFHPLVRQWFEERFGEPTEAQRQGWPEIAQGRHTLIAAPTGSGKTLAAFMVCLDRLVQQWLAGRLRNELQVVYVSPLKALSNDIQRNLQTPLSELAALAGEHGYGELPVRAMVRTGDTPASERQAMLRRPPHILVTTPESLYLLLTSERGRERLATVQTVIVDEIHALARDKRGSHLALSLERLGALCPQPPVRIGLSATQRPIEQIARFLVGVERGDTNGLPCKIVDAGHMRQLDIAVETTETPLEAICSMEQWEEVYQRLISLIRSHRSTLVFVNTRRLAERVSLRLGELLGEGAAAAHHGSMSRALRLSAEQRLKNGQLKAIVATASLEMGIDIGYIDLVCQIGSPRSIATALQRVGRSGHSLGALPKGRLFPLTRDELLESFAVVRAIHRGVLDAIEIPEAPLDILAQQLIAEVACREWTEDDFYKLVRRAWPFRNLPRDEYDNILQIVSNGIAPGNRRGRYVHRDRIHGQLRPRRGARLAALTSGGAIPEAAEYRVVTEDENALVGTLDEHYAVETSTGDVFVLGNTSWRVRYVRGSDVVVQDAGGMPPNIPFWFGEAPGRTIELSHELSELRLEIGRRLRPAVAPAHGLDERLSQNQDACDDAIEWLQRECGASSAGAEHAVRYVAAQLAAVGFIPSDQEILFERFFDESGGMQLVIHAPLGVRINRAWGLALRKRFCRSFDFELQAAATDNGIVLSLSPQHSVPLEDLFKMLNPGNGRYLLEQAVLAVPMFQLRWRWNATRALAILRFNMGKKVPPHLQRFRSDDLLAATFPETVGCLENHHGDVEIPDHPLVRQTMYDCLHEAMDIDHWLQVLGQIDAGAIKLVGRETREPSPFSHELLNANPYAFLDDAPLEERRTRAVQTRRSLSPEDFRNLAQLDEEAIAQVRQEAWPLVRDAEELHEVLLNIVALRADEAPQWQSWFVELVACGRAAVVEREGQPPLWIAAEQWPLIRAVYPQAGVQPQPKLPPDIDQEYSASDGWIELARGWTESSGPTTASNLARRLGLAESQMQAALEALEGRGLVLRGQFIAEPCTGNGKSAGTQWCDRRLLARIHRLTLAGLRRKIQPVDPEDYLRFLARHHRLVGDDAWGGPVGVREAVVQLQGFELAAGAWEAAILAPRVRKYDPSWLDQLFLTGEATWGRLCPPRPDPARRTNMAALTRAVPISLIVREDLPWLMPPDRQMQYDQLTSKGQAVWKALDERGALFFNELRAFSQLLPARLEEALRELAAVGLISADTFAAVRAIIYRGKRLVRHARDGVRSGATTAAVGRWSRFPSYPLERPDPADYLERWCRQLLLRYGVLFRDVLSREAAAPPWHALVGVLRRLELRGEIRGGRFVRGVSGEQYASEVAIEQLRAARDDGEDSQWLLLSASDPVNLVGIITDGPRIPAIASNAVVLRDGRCIATRQAGRIEILAMLDAATESALRSALQAGNQHGRLQLETSRPHFSSV